MADDGSPEPPTALAKKFVLYVVGFSVGIAAPLAPLLANAGPGSLLGLFPPFVRITLVPVSGFVMGVIALAVQFYRAESVSRARIRRLFGALAAVSVLAPIALAALLMVLIEDVPIEAEARTARVLIGFARSSQCGCPQEISQSECLAELGPENSLAVDSCWPSRWRSELSLALAYFATIGGLGSLVGLLLLQGESRRSRRRGSPRSRANNGAPPPTPST